MSEIIQCGGCSEYADSGYCKPCWEQYDSVWKEYQDELKAENEELKKKLHSLVNHTSILPTTSPDGKIIFVGQGLENSSSVDVDVEELRTDYENLKETTRLDSAFYSARDTKLTVQNATLALGIDNLSTGLEKLKAEIEGLKKENEEAFKVVHRAGIELEAENEKLKTKSKDADELVKAIISDAPKDHLYDVVSSRMYLRAIEFKKKHKGEGNE